MADRKIEKNKLLFSDLTGAKLKKMLNATKASRRYHNKNKSGGNFGINVYTDGKDSFEINGRYNTQGEITSLGVGRLWGMPTDYRSVSKITKTQLLNIIKAKYNQVISGDIHAAEDDKKCSVCGNSAVHILKKGEIVLCDKHYQQQFGKYSAELVSINEYPRGIIAGMIGGALAITSYLLTKNDSIWKDDIPQWLKLGSRVLIVSTGFAAGIYGSEIGYNYWDNKKL